MKRVILMLIVTMSCSAVYAKQFMIGYEEQLWNMFPEVKLQLEQAFYEAGHTVKFRALPGERVERWLQMGEIDGEFLAATNYNEELENIVPIKVVLASVDIKIISRTENSFNRTSEILGKRLVVKSGAPVLEDASLKLSNRVTLVEEFDQGLKMIEAKRADAMLMPEELLELLAPEGAELTASAESIVEVPFYFWLNTKNLEFVNLLTEKLSD